MVILITLVHSTDLDLMSPCGATPRGRAGGVSGVGALGVKTCSKSRELADD